MAQVFAVHVDGEFDESWLKELSDTAVECNGSLVVYGDAICGGINKAKTFDSILDAKEMVKLLESKRMCYNNSFPDSPAREVKFAVWAVQTDQDGVPTRKLFEVWTSEAGY